MSSSASTPMSPSATSKGMAGSSTSARSSMAAATAAAGPLSSRGKPVCTKGSPSAVFDASSAAPQDSSVTLPPDSCGGRSIHAFSDSESDGPGSGLDDSDGSEKKGTATVKVAKRSNSSFQRIEALLSSKDNFLSRGFSWRQGSSNSGGSSKNLNSSTMTNALATSTGALLLSPASPSHDSMADATATILQPSSPGRATSPPALTSSYNAASSNSASLSGLAASVGSLLLGRSLGGSEAGNNDVGKQASSSSLNGSRGGGGGSVTGGAAVALSASSRVLVEEEEEQEEEQEQGKGKLLALVEDAAFAFPTPKPPTTKERRALAALARRLVMSKAEVEGKDEGDFELMAAPTRILLLDGVMEKIGTEARIKTTSRRRLLLFTDTLLVAKPPSDDEQQQEKIVVKQVIDLHHATIFDRSFIDPLSFEVQGPSRGWRFVAGDKEQHALWLTALRGAVLGLAQDTAASEAWGWQHRLYRGTLFSAALEGDVPQLEAILAHQHRSSDKEEEEEEEAMAELLAAKDEWGLQPVHYAAGEGQEAALLFLLDKGGEASPPSATLDIPLHYAAAQGQDQAVLRLLQKGADPHALNFQDRTPLLEAVAACDTLGEKVQRCVALLHQLGGVDLEAVDASGSTPLHKACAAAAAAAAAIEADDHDARLANATGMVRLLARLGANPNALRASHSNSSPLLSPLQLACGAETDVPANEEVLTLLLQAGAAPNGTVKGPRPLELLLTSKFFDSGDPSKTDGPTTLLRSPVVLLRASAGGGASGGKKAVEKDSGWDALEEAVAKEVLALRLSLILTLVQHGARLSVKRLAEQGVDASIIAQIQAAQAEWEGKELGQTQAVYPKAKSSGVASSPCNASFSSPPDAKSPAEGQGAVAGSATDGDNACPLCGTPFTLLFRRHHCRVCGGLACALCSSKKLAMPKSSSKASTATALSLERACDPCFNAAHHAASQIRMEEEQTAAASHDANKKKEKEQQQQYVRNQAELGLLNPSGRTTADPLGAQRPGGAKPGDFSASGMTARSLGAAAQAHSVMAENMQLIAERGERLNRLAERTRGMQQGAVDFAEMAKALAEREKNRKWWEM